MVLIDEQSERAIKGGLEPFTIAMIALGAGLLIGGALAWWSRRKANRGG